MILQLRRRRRAVTRLKERILGRNAARVYGIDLGKVRNEMAADDLQWGKLLMEDFRRNGFAALR